MISRAEKRYETVKAMLETYGQEHLLRFYDELAEAQKEALLGELEAQEWEELAGLVASHVLAKPEVAPSGTIEPAPYYPREPSAELEAKYREARALGESLLRNGKVAAFTVAGGQGTRLGWDGPKGTFPATPITGKPLFRVFAEFLLKAEEKYGSPVPWYIMTSPLNDRETREFFKDHDFFGLDPAQVMLFVQGTLPSIGFDGKVLLAEKGRLALNPDGHGGSLRALRRSGALDDMRGRGVEEVSYFQVDNPNVKCLDPLFIGLHKLDGAEMSSKMLLKREPLEKVGNFCLIDGRVSVIEYSDMPEDLAKARSESGALEFNAGSIAIHVLSVGFVRRLSEGGRLALPLHRAEKKVSHVDLEMGTKIRPEAPNAVKLEAFVFDALPLAERSIILETERVEEFAPIKNAEGEDSPRSSQRLQSLRAARWLSGAGVEVPFKSGEVEAIIELSHLTAIEPSDLEKAELPPRIEPGGEVVL